ncbi:NUDIX domain-containing protein [Streptobacillus canis]|uniref:NUDIX domain-containing protein n=1 Tax=Streptobacillus canis TaxID=2678686 RepID=UPI0018CC3CAD|nr:NUDIX hydrolase [Streptobacillus canis]
MIKLSLKDEEWEYTYIDHDRVIVRAIVFDDELNLHFVKVSRDDEFGNLSFIETAGGGVEVGENLEEAIIRELKEELGVEVEIVTKIGVVHDYYNLIHRRNINNYYLCKIRSIGEKNMTESEMNDFNMDGIILKYDEAIIEYEKMKDEKLGRLIANRELPVLREVKKMLDM